MSRSLSRAARLRQIENLLFRNAHGMRVVDIAEAFGVNRRTIYRDLDLLSESGVPIWQDDGRFGIIREQYLATIRLRFDEAVARTLLPGCLAATLMSTTEHRVGANKLAVAFPDPLAEHIAHRRNCARSPDQPASCRLRPSRCAGRKPQGSDMVSLSSKRYVERTCHIAVPAGTVHDRLYVIGYDDWAQDVRTFKLDRLERAEPRLSGTDPCRL